MNRTESKRHASLTADQARAVLDCSSTSIFEFICERVRNNAAAGRMWMFHDTPDSMDGNIVAEVIKMLRRKGFVVEELPEDKQIKITWAET